GGGVMDPVTLALAKNHNVGRVAKAGDAEDVQRLLNEVGSKGGGTVFMPPGEYVVSKSILIPSNCNLVGSGPGTILKGGFPPGVVNPSLVSTYFDSTTTGYDGA